MKDINKSKSLIIQGFPGKIFLSKREGQVLLFLLSEMKPVEIASTLGVTIKTVSSHKRNAMKKIGVDSTSQLHKWLIVNFHKIKPQSYSYI